MALRWTCEQRTVLVRDSNKVVAVVVFGSPKVKGAEIEAYAGMTSVQEEVQLIIGSSCHWIKQCLTTPLVTRLKGRDLKTGWTRPKRSGWICAVARKFLVTGQA